MDDDATDEPMVANPIIGWLNTLKSSVESAVAEVPSIDSATESIGPGPAWTGTRADEVHEDLAAIAQPLKNALNGLADDVQDAIDAVQPRRVSPGIAKVIRIDHGRF